MSRLFLLLFFSFISFLGTLGQSYRLEPINQNQLRNQQLLGEMDSSISFTVQSNSIIPPSKTSWKKPTITLLPFVLTQQFNSSKPFGWNDGPMMQVKGYQVLARPGINMRLGVFEAQAAPEILYSSYQSYAKLFPGQSFLKAHLGPISLGVSSENLWWGPGIYSSLLMSNNAPGFLHGFIGTNKPFQTPIGNIEFKLIGARLSSNQKLNYENGDIRYGTENDDWRYLNSYVISWQPKWVKGVFLGISRSMQQYGEQSFNRYAGFVNRYLPVIGLPIQKNNNLGDDTLNRDQLASFFLRWLMPKSNSEFYLEYGRNDYALNFRDYLSSPSHSAAYTIGFRKLIPQKNKNYLQLEAELTQMSQSPDHLVRDAGNWYVHWQIYQGYTQNNQIMGAGAGFGANVQTVSATWINGEIRNGFLIQRIERDPVNRVNKWTDFSIGWMPQWTYKNMLLSAKVQLIHSNNYSWEKGNNSFNLHSRLMVQYNFK